MNERTKNVIFAVSMLASLLIVSVAAFQYWKNKDDTDIKPAKTEKRDVTKDELSRSNGKMGQPCLVAVDGNVYKIEGFSQWRDGEHTTSGGQAYCGADMTAAIEESPHGRAKLEYLEEIGKLVD